MCNKLLKKLTAAVLCVLLGISAVAAVCAAQETEYNIEEISGMKVSIAPDMLAVTRNTDSSDGFFNLPNNSYEDVMKKMRDGNIYLLATDSQQSITVAVSMFENDDTHRIDNYNRLSGEELNDIVLGYKKSTDGTTYNASTVDEVVDDIVWIDFEFRATVDSSVYKQYQSNTVVNGKNVSITIQRNGADAIGSDYDVLKKIVSSVKFANAGMPRNLMLYIIIGAAAAVIIILIIVIIVVKRANRRRKKTKNDKIIEELASKYSTGRQSSREAEGSSPEYSEPERQTGDTMAKTMHFDMHKAQKSEPAQRSYDSYDDDEDSGRPVKSYTDEEIARLLGDVEDDENFIEPLSVTKADSGTYAEEESVETSLETPELHEEADPEAREITLEQDLAEIEAEKPLKSVREVFDFSKFMKNARKKAELEQQQAEISEEQPEALNLPEEPEESEPEETPQTELADTEEALTEETMTEEAEEENGEDLSEEPDEEELSREEAEQQELDEYNNDEVLVREEAKHNKFSSSSDYFEEAPQKVIGVISRAEIEDAEEFDVIDEVEQRATEVEKEPERRELKKESSLKKIGGGVKNFCTHCGYFAENVKREIKRGKAKKNRKKAVEKRRSQVNQRAESRPAQKPKAENGGLVQVKSRGQRKPNTNRRG